MDKDKVQIRPKNLKEIAAKAVESPDIPKLYANGFMTGYSNSDLIVILQQNGMPIASLNLSFTTAKSLALKLGNLIKDIEMMSGQAIMTTDDVEKYRKKEEKKDGKAH
jgi:hypothetical protein